MRDANLAEFDAVLAVARRRNFRAAALELGIPTSTLSHMVATLEARLSIRLFNRTTRSVSLSPAGQQFVAQMAPALSEIREAMEAVNHHRERPTGTLRLHALAGAAQMILEPLIFAYLKLYPEMRLDLVTDGRMVDLVVDGFDAGVRIAEAVPKDMIAVKIGGPLRSIVAGAPTYIASAGEPTTPGDLAHHACIRSRTAGGAIYRWEFARRGQRIDVDVPGALTLDDSGLILRAAQAGLGLCYLPESLLAASVASGRLIQVLEDWTPTYPGLCLYFPGRRHVPAGLRAFADLARQIGRDPDFWRPAAPS